jgi:hypothetical protein
MKDKRHEPPAGYSPVEYGMIVYKRLPASCLTQRDTWCLKAYIESLEAKHDDLKKSLLTAGAGMAEFSVMQQRLRELEAERDEQKDIKLLAYEEIDYIKTELDVAQARVGEFESVIPPLLENAVILSDEYLSAFADYGPNDAIQGWEKSRWLRASAAKKNVERVLASTGAAERKETPCQQFKIVNIDKSFANASTKSARPTVLVSFNSYWAEDY